MPLGIAQEAATPSCSSRRSQCKRRALCSWTTKRGAPFFRRRRFGAGSAVLPKSRLRSYSPSSPPLVVPFAFAIGSILALYPAQPRVARLPRSRAPVAGSRAEAGRRTVLPPRRQCRLRRAPLRRAAHLQAAGRADQGGDEGRSGGDRSAEELLLRL